MICSVPTVYVPGPDLNLLPWFEKSEAVAPWVAADALGLPLSVLKHAFTSGQVPGSVWFLAELADGRAVVRYDVEGLKAWAAERPAIDTTIPTDPAYTASHVVTLPAPRPASMSEPVRNDVI